jgi:hypothetical protein
MVRETAIFPWDMSFQAQYFQHSITPHLNVYLHAVEFS